MAPSGWQRGAQAKREQEQERARRCVCRCSQCLSNLSEAWIQQAADARARAKVPQAGYSASSDADGKTTGPDTEETTGATEDGAKAVDPAPQDSSCAVSANGTTSAKEPVRVSDIRGGQPRGAVRTVVSLVCDGGLCAHDDDAPFFSLFFSNYLLASSSLSSSCPCDGRRASSVDAGDALRNVSEVEELEDWNLLAQG